MNILNKKTYVFCFLFGLLLFSLVASQAKEINPTSDAAPVCGSTWTQLWSEPVIIDGSRKSATSITYDVDMATTGELAILAKALQQGCQLEIVFSGRGGSASSFQCAVARASGMNFFCSSIGLGAVIENSTDVTTRPATHLFNPYFYIAPYNDAATRFALSMSGFTAQGSAKPLNNVLPVGGKPSFTAGSTAPSRFITVFGKI